LKQKEAEKKTGLNPTPVAGKNVGKVRGAGKKKGGEKARGVGGRELATLVRRRSSEAAWAGELEREFHKHEKGEDRQLEISRGSYLRKKKKSRTEKYGRG